MSYHPNHDLNSSDEEQEKREEEQFIGDQETDVYPEVTYISDPELSQSVSTAQFDFYDDDDYDRFIGPETSQKKKRGNLVDISQPNPEQAYQDSHQAIDNIQSI